MSVSEKVQREDFRTAPRYRLLLPIDIEFEGHTIKALILDISENGCLIEADRRMEPGENLRIKFHNHSDFHFSAAIVWAGEALCGCQFTKPLPKSVVSETCLWSIPKLIRDGRNEATADQLSHAIREARANSGLSAAELARRAGVSRPTLWSWETGRSKPTKENLASLRKALQLEANSISDKRKPKDFRGKRTTPFQITLDRCRNEIARELGVDTQKIELNVIFR